MDQAEHLLIVDDDTEILDLLGRYLTRNGYRVSTARDGGAMEAVLAGARIDLIILDIMLPGRDGLDITRDLRTRSNVPIIMVTARGDETDRIVGLEMGADDYLPKPFNPRELLARVKTVLRRAKGLPQTPGARGKKLRFEGWTLDLVGRELISPDGVHVSLTAGAFDLLTAFAEHPQRLLTRDQLLDMTRGRGAGPYDRSIDVHISRIRAAIEHDPSRPQRIKTVRAAGYVFIAEVDEP